MSKKPKIIVIMGPTASGKSAAAILLAKKLNGAIVSADSRQVFLDMDLGTGKVVKDPNCNEFHSEGVRHYLINIADPKDEFNVSHFKKAAQVSINEILKENKLPIICGGTGFWIRALIDNVNLPEVKPDKKLREQLSKLSAAELFSKLEKLDPERAKDIDKNNKVRLIRAIEITKAIGKVPVLKKQESKFEVLKLALSVDKEILDAKIKKRLEERLAQGMILEVQNLNNKGLSWKKLEAFGLEYRWIARYLQDKISLDGMKEKLFFEIVHYAKRQLTWLRKEKDLIWCKNYDEIERQAENFLQN
jgi:tRNA dimethylallyltransferase